MEEKIIIAIQDIRSKFKQRVTSQRISRFLNPLFYNDEKWPSVLLKFCGVNTARFLKYV